MEKIVGDRYEEGLNNLKKLAEKYAMGTVRKASI